MKKILTISFLVLFIANVFELHQIVKIPALVHHYFEHKNENQHQSFTEFLTDHYFEHHDHANANHRHDDLPFKSTNCYAFHCTIAFIQTQSYNHYQPVLFLTDLIKQSTTNFHFENFVGKIWQPPKI